MKKNNNLPILLFLLYSFTVLPALPSYGQTNDNTLSLVPPKQVQTFPEHLLYRNFFAHLKHLEDKSQNPSKPGEETLNEHYKKKLQLTDSEYQKILRIAIDCNAELSAHYVRRQEIITRLRAQTPGGKLSSKDQVPPVPDEVKQLQKEYEGILLKYSNRLKLDLSQARTSQVTTFLKQEFGAQLQVMKVDVPREHNPGKQKPPPFGK